METAYGSKPPAPLPRIRRQGWTTPTTDDPAVAPPDPPPHPVDRRNRLMSPSSGEEGCSSSSPVELLREETKSLSSQSSASIKLGAATRTSEPETASDVASASARARQRIREKTKSMVERQKMAKRLSISRERAADGAAEGRAANSLVAAEVAQQQGTTPEEIARGDAQIERGIQLGAKYVTGQLSWEQQQRHEFGIGVADADKADARRQDRERLRQLMLRECKPAPYTAAMGAKFGALLTMRVGGGGRGSGGRSGGKADAEGGAADQEAQSQPVQRVEQQKQSSREDLLTMKNDWLINPSWRGAQSQQQQAWHLLQWQPALQWDRWAELRDARRWAERTQRGLRLDLRSVRFDHHWLFSERKARDRALLCAFEAFADVHARTLRAVHEWLSERQRAEDEAEAEADGSPEVDGQQQQRILSDQQKEKHMGALFERVLQLLKEIERSTHALELAWRDADQQRGQFALRRIEGHAEMFEEDVPDALRAFFRSPMFTLSERSRPSTEEEAVAMGRKAETRAEAQRLRAVDNCRYQIQIFFNDVLVCASGPLPLCWSAFSVPIPRIYKLRVFEQARQLRIRLAERLSAGGSGSGWHHVSDIFVPLPEQMNETEAEAEGEVAGVAPLPQSQNAPMALQFASSLQRGSFKGSLGCGVGGAPHMQGRLYCTLQWDNGAAQKAAERRKSASAREKEAVEGKNLQTGTVPSSPAALFPSGTILCSEHTLHADARLRALERRWAERGTRHAQQQSRIELVEEATAGNGNGQSAEGLADWKYQQQRRATGAELELEARRRAGAQFAHALRRQLRERGEQRRRARDLRELVREEPMPSLASLVGMLPALFAARPLPMDMSRRLKPMRAQSYGTAAGYRHAITEGHLPKQKLILNIQFASAVPVRTSAEPSKLFLLCSTSAQSMATSVVDGRHANWQETLVLEVPEHVHSEQWLDLELFDLKVHSMAHDDREVGTRHERDEHRWLGSARVPLGALARMGKADGAVALRGPLFYTGHMSSSTTDRPTTVRLLLSIDQQLQYPLISHPPLQYSPSVVGHFNDSEANLLAMGSAFEQRFRQRFPARRVHAIVLDARGNRVLASRFLRPIAPPPHIVALFATNAAQSVALAAQTVACVPHLQDVEEAVGTTPIWSTVDEILRVGTASPDEAALLLCCWLLGLRLQASVLLGASVQAGLHAAAVLACFPDGTRWIIDPMDGHHFAPTDPACPLLSVGIALCADNAYANCHPRDAHPSQLDFDFAKSTNWEPLLGAGRTVADLTSVQPAAIPYAQTDEHALMELRAGLERDIRLRFDAARPFAIPQWNLLAARTLRELLADSWSLLPDASGSVSRLLDVDARLVHLQSAFHVTALAFRLPFTSRAEMVRHVLRTKVHTNADPQAQFALAVHFQPLLGDTMLACSIALCALLPNRP